MKLSCLLEGIEISEMSEQNAGVFDNAEIEGITVNSTEVKRGFLFICLVGTKTDGHKYICEAIENGAAAVVVERKPRNSAIPYILVKNTRIAEAKLRMKWHSNPAEGIKIIGITGTNGKTSVSYMINQILRDAGYKTALFGTIKYIIGDIEERAKLTTSDPEDMAKLFKVAKDNGIEYAVMEISSHSLELDKTAGLGIIDIGVFTNLTQDHLDFHGNMSNYKKAKAKLFKMCRIGVLNGDDSYAADIAGDSLSQNYFYGIKNAEADFQVTDIKYHGVDGIEYNFCEKSEKGERSLKVISAMPGEPYIYNTLAAVSVGKLLGIDGKTISGAIEKVKVRGRIEKLDTNTAFSVFIDYAHTPDALENLLQSVRNFTNGRIITVFGCGGDRDKSKRPLMGKIAYENSDFCVITSDNSRTENPLYIIGDIMEGIPKPEVKDLNSGAENVNSKQYAIVVDRKEAIEYAIDIAEAGDVILLAGKGHEDYISENGETKHFSEREIVFKYIRRIRRKKK